MSAFLAATRQRFWQRARYLFSAFRRKRLGLGPFGALLGAFEVGLAVAVGVVGGSTEEYAGKVAYLLLIFI